MFELDSDARHKSFSIYVKCKAFFPIIGAVLCNLQNGKVFVDNLQTPRQFYVEHSFGFAQVFGEPVVDFEINLQHYWFIEKKFSSPKVRLYGTYLPKFLKSQKYNSLLSFRQRFFFPAGPKIVGKPISGQMKKNLIVDKVRYSNIEKVDKTFGVVTRFWRNAHDFIKYSNAVLVFYSGELAGICYSAGQASNSVEVDVMTLENFQKKGVGKFSVSNFLERCRNQSLQPSWDCFANNESSLALAQSVGFVPIARPYEFYTMTID